MEHHNLYGLLGRHIAYSFSKRYFTKKFDQLGLSDHTYEIFDTENLEGLEFLIKNPDLQGFNVTIPYKEQIIPFLDALSSEAREIGAVNTVKVCNGKTTGYNTDAFGFEDTLRLHRHPHHDRAIVLGDGGAAKAVKYVLGKLKIPFITVSRRGDITFESLDQQTVADRHLIIQCTPVGTSPDTGALLPFPFSGISENHLVVDLIYNPEQTAFMKKAAEKGAATVNGYHMLTQQAEKAWEIWQS